MSELEFCEHGYAPDVQCYCVPCSVKKATEKFEQAKILAKAVADDYEHYVDNAHDSSCGDHPTCKHTIRWENARKLKELCQ